MSFKSPSLKEISQQVLADLKQAIGDPKYFMGASPLQALAYAVSGVSYMLHSHINHVATYQLMPDTAKGDALERWAAILNIPPRFKDESDDELRARILSRIAHPARGGTRSDYVHWVMDMESINAGKVWVYPAYPVPGSVGVTFITKDYKAPFPTDQQINVVQSELNSRIPIGTAAQVFPLLKKEITFKLEFLDLSDASTARDAIEHLLFDCAHPETTLTISKIQNTLAIALKGDRFSLVSPTKDISFVMGEFGTIGDFSWNHVNSLR